MKKKLILFSIISTILILTIPSIPGAQYNIAVQESRTQFFEDIQDMNLDEIKSILDSWDISEIRDNLRLNILELTDYVGPYIDIELILIILFELTAMAIGGAGVTNLLTIAIIALVIVYEIISGEQVERTAEMHSLFIESMFSIVIGLEKRFIRNPILQLILVFITTWFSTNLAVAIANTLI